MVKSLLISILCLICGTIVAQDKPIPKPDSTQVPVPKPKRNAPGIIMEAPDPIPLNWNEFNKKIPTMENIPNQRILYRLLIDPNGVVIKYDVITAKNADFANTIGAYLTKLTFTPPLENGKPTQRWINFPIYLHKN